MLGAEFYFKVKPRELAYVTIFKSPSFIKDYFDSTKEKKSAAN